MLSAATRPSCAATGVSGGPLDAESPAADEYAALGQNVALEEFGAGYEVLLAGDAELRRHRARGDQNEPRLNYLSRHVERMSIAEASAAVIGIDALAREALFHHRGNG